MRAAGADEGTGYGVSRLEHDLPATFIGCAGALELHVADNIEGVADVWRDFQASAWHTPFQDIDWMRAWSGAASPDATCRPFIVLGFEDNELRLILPLCVEQTALLTRLCWLAQSVNDYNAPMMDPQFAARCDRELADEIWSLVLAACGPVDLIEFSQQPAQIAGFDNVFVAVDAKPSSCSAHLVNLKPDWKSFFAGLRGSKSRRRMREKQNKLARLGKVQFRGEKRPAVRRDLIRQAIAWKSAQLEASGDRNPFSPDTDDPDAGSTIERTLLGLAEAAEGRHRLRVDCLFVDQRPVAVIIAFVGGGRYSVFITAHAADETSRFSPGTTLLVKTMELACRAGCRQYDLLAGDEAYKMSWCDEHLELRDEARGLTSKGSLAAAMLRLGVRAKRSLKQSPVLLHSLKRLNRQWSKSS